MELPKDFIEKYRHLLKTEANAFFDSFSDDAVPAFRINPLKKTQKSFPNKIPNTDFGYYGKVSGKSSEHVTGLVYSQEPAAQIVAQVSGVKPGMKVLDLAAAPGGKTTHLLSYMKNTGVLVSNEINTKRSKILVENIERFGAKNVIVTNESAANLAKAFPSFFDLIVLDAPCSGEGMFRKDPGAIQYWSKSYPNECSILQKELLDDAMKMLSPNGRIVYSTCTWAAEENEEVVKWLLDQYPSLRLEPIELFNGMQPGIDMPETARMYPHYFKGEGQFVAVLDNHSDQTIIKARNRKKKKAKKRLNLSKEQEQLWKKFEEKHLRSSLSGNLECFGDNLYLLPKELPSLESLKIARNGLHLGVFKKNRFEPSYALGLALNPDEVKCTLAINHNQFKEYVTGLSLTLEVPVSNGWYQLVVEGNGFGFAKVVGNTVKNYFPKGLRFIP